MEMTKTRLGRVCHFGTHAPLSGYLNIAFEFPEKWFDGTRRTEFLIPRLICYPFYMDTKKLITQIQAIEESVADELETISTENPAESTHEES